MSELSKIKYQVTKQLKTLKDDLVIIVDTREQDISHIIKYFNKYEWQYCEEKLDTGDFSFIYKDEDYTKKFTIDRKRLDEFIGNFKETKKVEVDGEIKKVKSERFDNEVDRMTQFDYAAFAIEDSKGFYEIKNGYYRSRMHKNSAKGKYYSLKAKGIHIDFLGNVNFAEYVLESIYYYIRSIKILEVIKNERL